MYTIRALKEKVISGKEIEKGDELWLCKAPTNQLCEAADEIRRLFCGNGFDICTIINGKCGRCSEDCKFCAQSSHYKTQIDEYPLLDKGEILRHANYNAKHGVLRYSIVTSGKRLSDAEVDRICDTIYSITETVKIKVCVSFGLLGEEQFRKIKAAGASRVHCNLETSRKHFSSVCTTHTYDDKIETLKAARRAGLSICSGGIMGLGESMEDRIDLAFALRSLSVKSIPINFLNPIKGTPYAYNQPISDEDKRRIVAIFRFILPDASIRLAGGRGLIQDKGERCFHSGSNAAISGDMLTTSGITIETDMKMLQKLGYKAELWDE